jgi:hypothetical protein
MKKTMVMAAVILLAACNSNNKTETPVTMDSDTAKLVVTPEPPVTPVPPSTTVYTPAEGDVAYRNGKLMVWKNNNYVEADDDVTLEGGVIVKKNGEVTKKDKTVKLEEGQSVSKTGKFFNKAGEGIDDAWQATKKGVGKAADAVKKAGKKVGEEVKEAVQ